MGTPSARTDMGRLALLMSASLCGFYQLYITTVISTRGSLCHISLIVSVGVTLWFRSTKRLQLSLVVGRELDGQPLWNSRAEIRASSLMSASKVDI